MPALQSRMPIVTAALVGLLTVAALPGAAQPQPKGLGPMPRPPVVPPHPAPGAAPASAPQAAPGSPSGPMPRPPVVPPHPAPGAAPGNNPSPAAQPAAAPASRPPAAQPATGAHNNPPASPAANNGQNAANNGQNAANNQPNPGMARGTGAGFGVPNAANPAMTSPYNPSAPTGYGFGGPGDLYGMSPYGRGYGAGASGYGSGSQAGVGSDVAGYGEDRSGSHAARQERTMSQILTASGVPNEDGRLLWPVGFRALGAREAGELRRQIDALMQEQAEQARAGPANPNLDQELVRATRALRKLLRRDEDERFSLPLTAYEDAEEFLAKLEHAETLLREGLQPPGEKARLEAQKGKVVEVGLHDNHFDPKTLTVSAGTTVRWTNQGQHGHTVTSDKADWGSKELGPGSSYSHTFARPGTYSYHCEVHPEEMRGNIIVK